MSYKKDLNFKSNVSLVVNRFSTMLNKAAVIIFSGMLFQHLSGPMCRPQKLKRLKKISDTLHCLDHQHYVLFSTITFPHISSMISHDQV